MEPTFDLCDDSASMDGLTQDSLEGMSGLTDNNYHLVPSKTDSQVWDIQYVSDDVPDEMLSQIDVDVLVKDYVEVNERFPEMVDDSKVQESSFKTYAGNT